MEKLLMIAVLLMAWGCFSIQTLAVLLLWRQIRPEKVSLPERSVQTEEPVSAAEEARRQYEQGFLNLMRYDGKPARRKERDGQ